MRYKSYLCIAASFLRVGSVGMARQNLVFALHFAPRRTRLDKIRRAYIAQAIEALR